MLTLLSSRIIPFRRCHPYQARLPSIRIEKSQSSVTIYPAFTAITETRFRGLGRMIVSARKTGFLPRSTAPLEAILDGSTLAL